MKSKFPELQNKNIIQKNKIILKYIQKFTLNIKDKFLHNNYFKIPHTEINFFFNKKLLENFDFKKNEFNKQICLRYLPLYFFAYLFYCIKIILFINFKSPKIRFFKIMIDNIESINELKLYNKLFKFYNKKDILIIATNPSVKGNNVIFFRKMKDYDLNLNDINFLFKFFFTTLRLSIFYKFNFIYLALKLIDDCFFYRTIFSYNKPKNIIMHQHYYSNNIKNFYFKKNGGHKSCLIQKNINTKNTNGFFYHADIIFTFGPFTNISNKKTYSKIKKNINIGSFVMDEDNENKIIKTMDIDVLYIGGNALFVNSYYDVYQSYQSDYIEQLNWLIRLSSKFPKLKIYFKHHPNNYANDEKHLFKKTNIKFIDQKLNTYSLCHKSKLVCSWASTMIIENKPKNFFSFFLDPQKRNNQFLYDIRNRREISLNNYDQFEKNVLKSQIIKYKRKSNKKFCIDNKKLFEKIYANLK